MISKSAKTRKNLIITVVALVMALTLSACGASNNEGGTASSPANSPSSSSGAPSDSGAAEKTVTDSMGHQVTIPANPQKVLASYLEDHLVTLGVKPVAQWSVANGIQDYLSSSLKDVPTISYDLPPESVASFAPDLILIGSASQVQNGLYDQYSKIAPTYVLGDDLIRDWRQTLLKIGELLGKSEEAKKAIEAYDAKAAAAKAKVESAIGSKSVAILWLVQKQFYMVDEKLSSGAVLYGDLGLKAPNLVTGLPESAKASWNPVTLEKLAELDADYVFLVNGDKGEGAETLKNPIWQGIPAVKAGHVYEMSSTSSWLYSGAIAGEKVMDDLTASLGIK
ncbi:ABC transporter substrate-binding protein [Cohnella candidum]|nr:ABC transporter substrate-binding protein [Cohnella candidum]